jgi:RNA polymerase sigma factor (sigma-70 family)
MDTRPDSELVRKSLDGDRAAFAGLVDRYQRLAYGVALSSTVDPGLAEDVAQDAFVETWQALGKLRAHERVAAFIVGVVRRLAKNALRARARRRAVAEAASADGLLPHGGQRGSDASGANTPLDDLLAAEEYRALTAALECLPAQHREVLVLFHSEAKSIAEVAAALGQSEQAVRQRLVRARALLRAEVEKSLEKALRRTRPRAAFTASVMAAIAALPTARALAGTAALSATIGIIMAKTTSKALVLAVAFLLLAGALAGGYWWSTSGKGPAAASAASAQPAPDQALAALKERRSALLAREAPLGTCRVHGIITRASDGTLIDGAVVSLVFLDTRQSLSADGSGAPPEPAQTDSVGRYELVGPRNAEYGLVATAPGFVPAKVSVRSFCESGSDTEVSFALQAGGVSITGTVADIGGGPIAGAVVTATDLRSSYVRTEVGSYATLSRSDGSYELSLAPGVYSLQATQTNYAASEPRVVHSGAQAQRVDLTLVPGATVAGIVRDRATGHGVPGAMVLARSDIGGAGATPAQALSRADGSFELTGLRHGTSELFARASEFGTVTPTSVVLGIGESLTDVEVWVDSGLHIAGYVVERHNREKPIAGALVTACQSNTLCSTGEDGAVPTGRDGYFAIHGLGSGSHRLLAGTPGASNLETRTVTLRNQSIDDLIIELEPGVSVSGRVTPAQEGVVIRLAELTEGSDWTPRSVWGACVTLGDGSFEIPSVARGRYALLGESRDGLRARTDVTVGDRDVRDVTLTLKAAASIEGRVVDEMGRGIGDVSLWIRRSFADRGTMKPGEAPSSEYMARAVEVGEDGAFIARALDAGEYELNVETVRHHAPLAPLAWADGGDPQHGKSVRVEAGEAKKGVTLAVRRPDATIEGRVVDAKGAAVADAWVTGKLERVNNQPSSDGDPALTDASGRFRLAGLHRASTYTLTAQSARNDARVRVTGVATGSRPTLTLEPVSALSGTVRARGRPVAGFRVSIQGTVERTQSVWNPEGAYRFSPLGAGTYEISVGAPDGHARGIATLGAGAAERLDLELSPWAAVRGRLVHRGDKAPLGDVTVAAIPCAQGTNCDASVFTSFDTRTDAGGLFAIERVPAQMLSLQFSQGTSVLFVLVQKEGYPVPVPDQPMSVTVEPGQTLDLGTIELITLDDIAREAEALRKKKEQGAE